MIEYVNLFLLLTMFGSTCYAYYRVKKFFYLISIIMDSEILDQSTNLGRDVDSEFLKPKSARKKKVDPKINEVEDNDIRDKRERLVACVLSGNSKMYLGKEYTQQQINEMDCTNEHTFKSVRIRFKCSNDQIVRQECYKFIFKHCLQCVRCWQSTRSK